MVTLLSHSVWWLKSREETAFVCSAARMPWDFRHSAAGGSPFLLEVIFREKPLCGAEHSHSLGGYQGSDRIFLVR